MCKGLGFNNSRRAQVLHFLGKASGHVIAHSGTKAGIQKCTRTNGQVDCRLGRIFLQNPDGSLQLRLRLGADIRQPKPMSQSIKP